MSVLPLASIAGFSCRNQAGDELTKHRCIWESQGVIDYQYRLQVLCFRPPEVTNPVIVGVSSGVIL